MMYDFLNTVFTPMNMLMDWAQNKPIWVEISAATVGVMGYAGALLAPILIPMAMVAAHNAKKMERTYKALDESTTRIFNAQANPKDYSAFETQAVHAAVALKDKMGNGLVYSDESACAEKHALYARNEYTRTQVVSTGRSTIIIPHKVVEFIPAIVAFQAAATDPEIAVPLYSSAQEGYAYRADGNVMAYSL
jgi:hypothetical protein